MNFYLTNKATPDGVYVQILPSFMLEDDTCDDTLTRAGFVYGEFSNTGHRVLLKTKNNRRWLSAWEDFVTDFDVYDVDTVVDKDGVIWTARGEKRKGYKLYTKTSNLDSTFYNGLDD